MSALPYTHACARVVGDGGKEVLIGAMMMIGLNLNVIRPTGTATNAKLPVVVWIYGGGFAFGSNAVCVSTLLFSGNPGSELTIFSC